MTAAIYTVGALWVFWALYVLVMGVWRAKLSGRLTWITTFLSLPFLVAGLVMDVAANLTVASLVFLEPPREWLVTQRLQRHMLDKQITWRYHLSSWICKNLLDLFDPTEAHCD